MPQIIPNVLIRHILFNYTNIDTITGCLLGGIKFDNKQMELFEFYHKCSNKYSNKINKCLNSIGHPYYNVSMAMTDKYDDHMNFWKLCLTDNIECVKWCMKIGFDIHYMNEMALLICHRKNPDMYKLLLSFDDIENYDMDVINNFINCVCPTNPQCLWFALDPQNYQPSGSMDMSYFDY